MAKYTSISWTDSTWNPWWGCTEVGAGCDACYARTFASRYGFEVWGQGVERRYFGDDHWNEPVKWHAKAQREGRRLKVFCASMADVFDNEVEQRHRDRLWALVRATPSIDWQIVTHRIGNARKMLPDDWGSGYANVWLILSVSNQEEFDRDVPKLLAMPARIRGLSIEPMLGPIDLDNIEVEGPHSDLRGWTKHEALSGRTLISDERSNYKVLEPFAPRIDWVIVGGESGANTGPNAARPFQIVWAAEALEQCRNADVAFFMKQLGSNHDGPVTRARKGDDPSEWPRRLRVQEFPR